MKQFIERFILPKYKISLLKEKLERCCLIKIRGRLQRYFAEANKVELPVESSQNELEEDERYFGLGWWEELKQTLWQVFEYPHTSVVAKVCCMQTLLYYLDVGTTSKSELKVTFDNQ